MGTKMPLPSIPPRAVPRVPTKAEYAAGMRTKNGRDPGWKAHAEGKKAARPGQRITNWNSRHNLILWMDIAGMGTQLIAEQINMHPSSISAIKSSELYQTQKLMLTEKLTESTLSNVIDIIRADVPKNVQFLIDMRDKINEHGGDPRVRVSAARQLSHEADRVYPRKSEHHEERVVRISIDAPQLHRLACALHDVGAAIPTEVIEELDPHNVDDSRPILEGKTIDQLITELRPTTGDAE